jgi:uncharacterized protein involved in propanediol utilization
VPGPRPTIYHLPPRVGTASSPVRHGEILQGAFYDGDWCLRRGLVPLPCAEFTARAAFTPMPIPSVVVLPPSGVRAARAAQETLSVLGWPSTGGYLELTGAGPAAGGSGAAADADVLAAIRAVQDAFRCALPGRLIGQIAVRAQASPDPLLFGGRPVLLAPGGMAIEEFTGRLPRLAVVGFGTSGADPAVPPPDYRAPEIRRFHELRRMLRTALATSDARLLGAVATESAVINQRYLPVEPFELIAELVRRVSGVGLQVAHSGEIAGLLFDARHPDSGAHQDLACELLGDIGITDVWRFTAGG